MEHNIKNENLLYCLAVQRRSSTTCIGVGSGFLRKGTG